MDTSDTRNDAMRHIMWNVLLAKRYFTLSSKRSNRTDFARRVTDANEECGNNPIDTKEMDYHNNAIGRDVYWDNTGHKEAFGIKYAVKEASTATYVNDALDRVNNKSCYIVKTHKDKTYPENQLPKNTRKSAAQIREKIRQISDEKVVYIKGPIANSLNLNETQLGQLTPSNLVHVNTSKCESENIPQPWFEETIKIYPRGIATIHRHLRKYYDPKSGKIVIPIIKHRLCAKHRLIKVKCFKL